MKSDLKNLLPKKLNDVYFWLLSIAIFLPIVYISFGEMITYMAINFTALIIFLIVLILRFTIKLVKKEKISVYKSKALFLLMFMFIWMLVGTFFAQNQEAAWFGMFAGYHQEVSVWQYAFFVLVSLMAVSVDKGNIKFLLYEFIFVALIIMSIQFCKQNYNYGFINRNFSGYYICTTTALSIGLLLFSKNIFEIVFLSLSVLTHFSSLVLNGSFGPILGLIAFLLVGFIYFIIHNRKIFIKFFSVCLACILVFSLFDFVPSFSKYKCEKETVIDQLCDTSVVFFNKIGVITDERYKELESGKNSNGEEIGNITIGDSVIIQSGISPGSKGYDRFDMWERSLENMKEFPVFGVGAGSWWTYNPDMPVSFPHNEFMHYGACFGLPVLIIYILLFIFLFFKFRKKHKQMPGLSFVILGAIFTYLVQSTFGGVWPFTTPILYILVGFAIKFIDLKKDIKHADEKLEAQQKE